MTGFSSVRSAAWGSHIDVMDGLAAVSQSQALIQAVRGCARVDEVVQPSVYHPLVVTKNVNQEVGQEVPRQVPGQ